MTALLLLKIAGLLAIQLMSGDAVPCENRPLESQDLDAELHSSSVEGSGEDNPPWPDDKTLTDCLVKTNKTIQINLEHKKIVEEDLLKRITNILAVVVRLEPCFEFELEGKGSSYEDLRVGQPDEYDYGLVNKDWTGKVSREKSDPFQPDFGYAKDDVSTECLEKFRDSNNRLDPVKMRGQLKDHVKTAMDELKLSYEVIWEQGPSVSFQYKSNVPEVGNIDVDLAIGIQLENWPEEAIDLPQKYKDVGVQLVPKPLPDKPMLWQVSFSQIELQMVKDIAKMPGERKPILMLAKYFKGNAEGNWEPLQSYHLKTIFLTMNKEMPEGKDWTVDKLATRFKDLITRALTHIQEQSLPSYYVPSFDLFKFLDKTKLPNAKAGIYKSIAKLATCDVEAEPEVEADQEAEPEVEGEQEAQPEGEQEPEPEGEQEAEPEGEQEAETEGEQGAKPEGEQEADVEV